MNANKRKIVVGAAAVLGLLLLLLGKSALGPGGASGDLEEALRQGLQNAQQGLQSDGAGAALDRLGRPRLPTAPGEAGETRSAGTTAPGGLIGGGAAALGGGTGGGGGAGEDAKERLKRVGYKTLEKGERRMYGADGGGVGGGAGTFKSKSYRAPDEAEIAAKMAHFLNRVRQSGGGSLGGGADAEGGGDGGSGGGSLPILTLEGIDEDKKTPAMKMLEKLNKQSMHSVVMSDDPGLQDGSRDKSGKSFDGNAATFGAIPVEEINGAFGQKQIRAVTETEGDAAERVPSLR